MIIIVVIEGVENCSCEDCSSDAIIRSSSRSSGGCGGRGRGEGKEEGIGR